MRHLILLLTVCLFIFCETKSGVEKDNSYYQESFTNTRWVLQQIEGSSVKSESLKKEIFIQFIEKDQFVRGHGGCNNYNSNFNIDFENNLKIGAIASTRMTCPAISTEQEYFDRLKQVNKYQIDKDILILLIDNRELLRYKAIFLK